MPVTKPAYEKHTPRANGLIPVTESVWVPLGGVQVQRFNSYVSQPDGDFDYHLAETVLQFKQAITETEFEHQFDIEGPLVLKEQTVAQFLAKLRTVYRGLRPNNEPRIAGWILRRLEAGHITEAQLRTGFGLGTSAERLAKFKARLKFQSDALMGYLTALGQIP